MGSEGALTIVVLKRRSYTQILCWEAVTALVFASGIALAYVRVVVAGIVVDGVVALVCVSTSIIATVGRGRLVCNRTRNDGSIS